VTPYTFIEGPDVWKAEDQVRGMTSMQLAFSTWPLIRPDPISGSRRSIVSAAVSVPSPAPQIKLEKEWLLELTPAHVTELEAAVEGALDAGLIWFEHEGTRLNVVCTVVFSRSLFLSLPTLSLLNLGPRSSSHPPFQLHTSPQLHAPSPTTPLPRTSRSPPSAPSSSPSSRTSSTAAALPWCAGCRSSAGRAPSRWSPTGASASTGGACSTRCVGRHAPAGRLTPLNHARTHIHNQPSQPAPCNQPRAARHARIPHRPHHRTRRATSSATSRRWAPTPPTPRGPRGST
jgi:hypothetical protein